MGDTPEFFVPMVPTKNQEEMYSQLAQWCHQPVPEPQDRIYSITFVHDGEEWTATVGEYLRGVKYRQSRSKGHKVEQRVPLSDPAIVLAIFPGNPFVVVTNHQIAGDIDSAWENPFLAGEPISTTHFRAT